ncbi:MAG: hypothetical protein WC969_07585 [Elusimicrobiota bacterium]|jgi:hypothetical protein
MDPALIRRFLKETRVLRPPRRRLSTFGATKIEYHLVSPVEDLPDKTRLREGTVLSEKPKVLTAEALRERFEGFGDDARGFEEWLQGEYRDLLRALEYRFRNDGLSTRVLTQDPRDTARRIIEDLDARDSAQGAVILCPDGGWSLALMKFTLDEAARSFPGNVRDLERREGFDPGAAEARRRRAEVERLFSAASADASAREGLRRRLEDFGLFGEYEDRFLSLYK